MMLSSSAGSDRWLRRLGHLSVLPALSWGLSITAASAADSTSSSSVPTPPAAASPSGGSSTLMASEAEPAVDR
jgi:hypothetical protein